MLGGVLNMNHTLAEKTHWKFNTKSLHLLHKL